MTRASRHARFRESLAAATGRTGAEERGLETLLHRGSQTTNLIIPRSEPRVGRNYCAWDVAPNGRLDDRPARTSFLKRCPERRNGKVPRRRARLNALKPPAGEHQAHAWMNPDSNAVYASVRTSANNHPFCAVCGMDVDAVNGPKSVYKGKTHYFCSADHKDQFDGAPAKFWELVSFKVIHT